MTAEKGEVRGLYRELKESKKRRKEHILLAGWIYGPLRSSWLG